MFCGNGHISELGGYASGRLVAGRVTDTGQDFSELPGTLVLHVVGSGVGLETTSP
jgi:hypothetical protein